MSTATAAFRRNTTARTRHATPESEIPLLHLPAAALRAVRAEGYTLSHFRDDVLAGLVVGIVALPLAMALAIAVGVAPQHGLYTAIVAGFVVALLGGSRFQVTGPTAAFIVILAPIQAKFGLSGLLLSGMMGGLLLLLMGVLRLGRFIEFIPHPVTTGFTAGIATVIAALQIKDFFGLSPAASGDHFFERLAALADARGTASPWEFALGAGTLGVLVLFPKLTRRVPAPLVALPLAAVAAHLLSRWIPGFEPATIAGRFHTVIDGSVVAGIPRLPPLPIRPWLAPGPGGQPLPLTFETIRALLPGAFAIAMLGAIESLLSAVVADGMGRTRHDPDAELMALGTGNLLVPFFGGIPATGAIARTATAIRCGARSPVAAMVHAVTILAAILALAPWIGLLPMAALAALLLLVAWNMSEVRHFGHILRVAPRSDVLVLLLCYALTVAFDMVIAVSVGVVLAALLFMKRMSEVTRSRILAGEHPALPRKLPPGVIVYDIDGPLFFGAVQKAMGALGAIADEARAVIFRMEEVHVIDATGLVALESALERLHRRGCLAVLVGVPPQPERVLRKAGITEDPGRLLFHKDIHAAILSAEAWLESTVVRRRFAKGETKRTTRSSPKPA